MKTGVGRKQGRASFTCAFWSSSIHAAPASLVSAFRLRTLSPPMDEAVTPLMIVNLSGLPCRGISFHSPMSYISSCTCDFTYSQPQAHIKTSRLGGVRVQNMSLIMVMMIEPPTCPVISPSLSCLTRKMLSCKSVRWSETQEIKTRSRRG